MIDIFIPCIPPTATAQQKGIVVIGGKPRTFKKKNVKQAEHTLIELYRPHAPAVPFEGPVQVRLAWISPWRRSEPKYRRKWGVLPKDTSPDLDNLCKLNLDALTALRFWLDDGQVARLELKKQWGDAPGIALHVWPMLVPEKTK